VSHAFRPDSPASAIALDADAALQSGARAFGDSTRFDACVADRAMESAKSPLPAVTSRLSESPSAANMPIGNNRRASFPEQAQLVSRSRTRTCLPRPVVTPIELQHG
jgi:hypothetical protein